MAPEAYELLSMAARYWFAGLAFIIIWRCWKCMHIEGKKGKALMSRLPEAGIVGEMLVITGSGDVKRGSRYKIPREGIIGSGHASDIQLVAEGIAHHHARIEIRENCIAIHAIQGAPISQDGGPIKDILFVMDGELLRLANIVMQVTIYDEPDDDIEPEQNFINTINYDDEEDTDEDTDEEYDEETEYPKDEDDYDDQYLQEESSDEDDIDEDDETYDQTFNDEYSEDEDQETTYSEYEPYEPYEDDNQNRKSTRIEVEDEPIIGGYHVQKKTRRK